MNNSIETEIINCEARLRQAMLCSDVKVLDELLAPELIFTNHLGQLFSKQDDLSAHRAGIIKIESITSLEETIRILGDVAIVLAKVYMLGSIADVRWDANFRFTRIWASQNSGGWQIVVAHSTIVA
ncbi:MAG: nuclear transport factor 2 family protein [Calothrix sp. SM1_7_51]|nr:nuclear transport factor 2 family protein [Calothrix sp. SM1_7_51]